jgi:hypothetical protein
VPWTTKAKRRKRYAERRNTPAKLQELNRLRRLYYERKRQHVLDYKAAHPCVDCGETDIRCLDFDHRDPKEKKFLVSEITLSKRSVLDAEMAKCDIRCANCHRKRHFDPFHPERRMSAVMKKLVKVTSKREKK